MSDSPELAEARSKLTQAIEEFVLVTAKEREGRDGVHANPVMTGFAGYAEYSSLGLMDDDSTAGVILVPDNQTAATARGLMEFGADAFGRKG